MNREIIILNNTTPMISAQNINSIITEINKLKINKNMKKILLIASLNLLSSVKTTKGLVYQLENFRNQGKIYPEKTRSKYINTILKDLKNMSISDFTNNINNLINFLNINNITIKI
ncbi:MAG: hypothetical protein J6A89_06320 [Clostridia bacterium]|nr:hypothetical protein [Clostridia bacterium]